MILSWLKLGVPQAFSGAGLYKLLSGEESWYFPYSFLRLAVTCLTVIWLIRSPTIQDDFKCWTGWARLSNPSVCLSRAAIHFWSPDFCSRCRSCWSRWIHGCGYKLVCEITQGRRWWDGGEQTNGWLDPAKLLMFNCLDLFPDNSSIFHTARKPWKSCLLAASITRSSCSTGDSASYILPPQKRSSLPFWIGQSLWTGLYYSCIFHFWDECGHSSPPLNQDSLGFPNNSQQVALIPVALIQCISSCMHYIGCCLVQLLMQCLLSLPPVWSLPTGAVWHWTGRLAQGGKGCALVGQEGCSSCWRHVGT